MKVFPRLHKRHKKQITEQISLNLTLEELQLIDKFVELDDDAQQLLDKIKEAYPPKSPVEEAYKDWWGEYPPTTQSVGNDCDLRWRAFQVGYNAGSQNVDVEFLVDSFNDCLNKIKEKLR